MLRNFPKKNQSPSELRAELTVGLFGPIGSAVFSFSSKFKHYLHIIFFFVKSLLKWQSVFM